MGVKTWVCAGRSEQVKSEYCLGDETVPFLGGGVRVARDESSVKVILECANCTFGGVAAMCIWGGKLEFDILFLEGFLPGTVSFIVKDVESGRRTALLEMFVVCFLGSVISRACRFFINH